ncbi:hypothetical protein JG687_00004459 [Phytophthora cactorum]|uniref:Uncharacterized protein n=1 Tax=Phytophthora cactorum TaxID=29920 RepID=A0A329SJI2_9STRA|nr:hypothetical protein Pcac1_g4525 [Phytophthora cactorum]KAG2823783.1 hypothetical protein PC112_g10374 [Phytophthora cactorum]KAG2825899.1 hypothetical protein PC111_g9193 [Phytophthora cactorum]KAG2858667.1 hypothetical protein PC113_g9607 [Phytophthora cactorum]KAG2904198.1 hypothetical protein PC114_g11934 [Phytophthora cactorum]
MQDSQNLIPCLVKRVGHEMKRSGFLILLRAGRIQSEQASLLSKDVLPPQLKQTLAQKSTVWIELELLLLVVEVERAPDGDGRGDVAFAVGLVLIATGKFATTTVGRTHTQQCARMIPIIARVWERHRMHHVITNLFTELVTSLKTKSRRFALGRKMYG